MKSIRFLAFMFLCMTSVVVAQEFASGLTIRIPMRDGTELPTDLYIPKDGVPADHPCILVRSLAGRKSATALRYCSLSEYGYVVAIQDTRSALDEEGKTFPGFSDGWGTEQDGYDTIEWLAKSDFCNGKVGTTGVSALGITQLLLAPTAPPSLKCQYIGVAASSIYHHAMCPGGQILKDQVEGWLGLYAWDTGVYSFATSRLFYNEFWEKFDTIKVADRVAVPAIHYSGWYDTFLQGTIDAFVSRQENGGAGAKGKQKLLIGPWTHFWPQSKKLGDFNVPEEGRVTPHDFSMKRWFDYHLKDAKNGVDDLPAVTYYVMGPFDDATSCGNTWRVADQWPVPSEKQAFYLNSDHSLRTAIAMETNSFSFEYDPSNPVPTLGGRNLFIESGPKDQRIIEERDDVLLFTSLPLEEDIEVTGEILCKLFFSSDKPDTDIVVRLTDVYPDGRSILVADGLARTGILTGLIEGVNHEEPMEIAIDLWSTSIVFAKGHRIRISVSSSNYPKYERNYNVGLIGVHSGDYAVAKNYIHVGDKFQSQLILPVVKAEGTKKAKGVSVQPFHY